MIFEPRIPSNAELAKFAAALAAVASVNASVVDSRILTTVSPLTTYVLDFPAGSTTWTAPFTGRVFAQLWGGGGPGGNAFVLKGGGYAGAGGAGGDFVSGWLDVSEGNEYIVSVGFGSAVAEVAGEDSSLPDFPIIAAGGAAAVDAGPGTSGPGGSSTGGDIQPGGSGGEPGADSSEGSGGGGGGASGRLTAPGEPGENGKFADGGEGGDDLEDLGGDGGVGGGSASPADGAPGQFPGGGGGGAGVYYDGLGGLFEGAFGPGADGLIRLTWEMAA